MCQHRLCPLKGQQCPRQRDQHRLMGEEHSSQTVPSPSGSPDTGGAANNGTSAGKGEQEVSRHLRLHTPPLPCSYGTHIPCCTCPSLSSHICWAAVWPPALENDRAGLQDAWCGAWGISPAPGRRPLLAHPQQGSSLVPRGEGHVRCHQDLSPSHPSLGLFLFLRDTSDIPRNGHPQAK